ncbi:Ninja [Macleaya cordata]|uniref:Ninja-family protein n=1 Tax=Macleaya cordata TaxID=56857 RepID=A0A200RC28_MACCD|nr:Ninja [Macleaya cordata]
MEDENGIELSLGLSCGGSAGKSKGKDGCSSDSKTEEGGSSSKSIGDLKFFLNTGIEKQDPDNGPKKNDPAFTGTQTSQENFFTDLAKSSHAADASVDLQGNKVPQLTRYGGLWDVNNGRSSEEVKSEPHEIGEKMWPEAGNKRKMLLEEMNHQKRHEREIQHADGHSKSPSMGVSSSMKTSHISITTDEGSAAENEDVAESEAEGSSSRLVSHLEDGTKRYGAGGGSFEASKESHGFTNSSVKNIQGQKQSNVPTGNESKHGSMNYGIPISFAPVMNVPFSISGKVPNAPGAANTSGFPLASSMQMMRPANNERPGTQQINPGNLPPTFGYSPVQLPVLDTGHSWVVASHPQQFPPSYAGRSIGSVALSSDKSEDGLKISPAVVQALPHSSSQALPESELAKGSGKQQVREEGTVDGLRHEGSAIRPGVAPGFKFGGCGSYPDLPWVSTAGPNPDGRTISGVTYRYDNQMRIVCACHGSHMSPEEFVLHASADQPNPESNAGLASFPDNSPAASAQS